MTTPTTPVDHRKIADEIDTRIARVWAVYNATSNEAFNLNLLGFMHYILGAVPNAAYISVEVTDQGGESMTFRSIGVEELAYLKWEAEVGFEPQELAGGIIDGPGGGQSYVEIEDGHPAIDTWLDEARVPYLTIDALSEYPMNIEEYQLTGHSWFERIGNRHSGQGRIWIAPALLALTAYKIEPGMPTITYHAEAADGWCERLDAMEGCVVRLALVDGTTRDVVVDGCDSDPADGVYQLVFHDFAEEAPNFRTGEQQTIRCDEFTDLLIY